MRPGDLRCELRDGVLHGQLSGELDMSNAPEMREVILGATPNDAVGVLLDLTAVGYLDSAGIHLIYRLREQLRVRGQRLVVVFPEASPINDALRLAGIERGGDVAEDVESGLRLLRGELSADGATVS